MKRNAVDTRRRILEAAADEFATYGMSGARVDRIAETAGVSKPMIYFHFGCKEGLFNAVLDAELERDTERMVLNAADLPNYAGEIFDRIHDPRRSDERTCLQLSMWSKLERSQFFVAPPRQSKWRVTNEKSEKIRVAQEAGLLPDEIPPQHILAMVEAMACAWAFDGTSDDAERLSRRESVVAAVRLLVSQPFSARAEPACACV